MKQDIYSNDVFNKNYDKMRSNINNPNELIEIPNFRALVPDVTNKDILEIGCGYGKNAKFYSSKAKYILATDISQHMLDIAQKENKADNIEYLRLAMEDIHTLDRKFDIIISSLVFNYLEDYPKMMIKIFNLLKSNGVLIFSVPCPITTGTILTTSLKKYHTIIDGKWYGLVSDYNHEGKRIKRWNNSDVVMYHAKYSTIINSIIEAGLILDKLYEPNIEPKVVEIDNDYIHYDDKPYFIFIKAHKS